MINQTYQKVVHIIDDAAQGLAKHHNDYSYLLDKIGDARFVLIGEATHGTQEFYQARIEITQQLIEKKGFMAIAIEGDWPDVYRIHRYLQGQGQPEQWQPALAGFQRFPTWMWRNTTIPPFLQWLRAYNDKLPSSTNKVGFYGLDLYSLDSSMTAVIAYLATIDPEAAKQAQERYACFDRAKLDPQSYGYLTSRGAKKSCVQETVEQFLQIQHHAIDYVKQNGTEEEDYFYAVQNARIVKNAEHYYRAMYEDHISSWNIRDQHMAETLNVIADHLENHYKKPAKIIVWAHNSHVGDARATEMGERGEWNIGELTREHHHRSTFLIGFSTYQGTVTAASDWGAAPQCKKVTPGLEGSYEALFHEVNQDNFLLTLQDRTLQHYLELPRLQRAIGVVYRPDTERESHYFFTRLPYQFDAIIHFDQTTAVQPLDK